MDHLSGPARAYEPIARSMGCAHSLVAPIGLSVHVHRGSSLLPRWCPAQLSGEFWLRRNHRAPDCCFNSQPTNATHWLNRPPRTGGRFNASASHSARHAADASTVIRRLTPIYINRGPCPSAHSW